MSLEDLKNNLYQKDSGLEDRKYEKSEFNPEFARQEFLSDFQKREGWKKIEKKPESYQKKFLKIGGIAASAIVVLFGAYWFVAALARSAFSEDRVVVEIIGPEKVDSNQVVEYAIRYKNENRVALKNVEINLNYAENFQLEEGAEAVRINNSNSKIKLEEIEARSGGSMKIKGKFFAPEKYTVTLKAVMRYVPSNFNSVFEKRNNLNVEVKSSPISIEIDAPMESSDGNKVEYVIDYKNISSRRFENLRLEAEYPEGFVFASSEPQPSEGKNSWHLGDLNEDGSGRIIIQGEIYGAKNEAKVIKLFLRSLDENGNTISYGEREKLTRIITSPLSIRQTVNRNENLANVNMGETLDYVLNFKNEGGIGLRNVIVTCELKSAILDFAGLEAGNTFYESQSGIITWKAVDFPQLENLQPGEEGTVEFSIPILKNIPLASERDKNFEIISVARIDSPDIPTPVESNKIISSNKVTLKLNSKVVLETKGYYNDWHIKNSGPIPPQVGKETSYTLRWMISNYFNGISKVKLESSLPTGVKWKGKIYPESEKISFNERTNKIEWDISSVANGTGITSAKKEVSFQISIVPEINSVGYGISLLNPAILIAEDDFTGNKIKLEGEKKDTQLKEDSGLMMKDFLVVAAE